MRPKPVTALAAPVNDSRFFFSGVLLNISTRVKATKADR
jgi:hypothetical protein